MEAKETISVRLTKSVKHRLGQAVRNSRLNLSQYVEGAIEARLARDKIPLTPDFRAHFAKYPPINDDGKALASLLADRETSL